MFPNDNLNTPINTIYQKLLQKLTRDSKIQHVSQQLLSMAEHEERVLYVYSFLKEYRIIPLLLHVTKCEHASRHYRNLGNQCYHKQSLYEALQWYNLSLCYAPVLSDCFSLAASNRTAVLIALKKYKECISDIDKILKLPPYYPDRIKDKLIKRKKQCKEALNLNPDPIIIDEEDQDYLEVLKLNGPRHSSYAAASAKLRVEYNPDIGRHVIANEDIEVGEVIVQEDPFVTLMLKNQMLFSCAYCSKRSITLYPCPACCFAMYCNTECADKAWDEYHIFECPLMPTLYKMNFSKIELLALRITIKARTDHESWECLLASVLDAETLLYTNHWGHVIVDGREGDKWVYDSQYYSTIQTLCTNDDKRTISDIFQKCVSAAILLHCLAVADFIKMEPNTNMFMKQKVKRFAAGSLLSHLMTVPTNVHSINAVAENESGNYVDEYNLGIAPYAFLSLINHSCSPNVVRYSKLGSTRMSLIALRPIKKGMMLLDSYGYEERPHDRNCMESAVITAVVPSEQAQSAFTGRNQKAHHAMHTRDERHEVLKAQYKFLCQCEACINDWPLFQNLPVVQNLPGPIAKKCKELLNVDVIEALQKGDHDTATKLYKPLCELANDLEPYMPCRELAECQEAMKQCLAIMTGVVPHGYTKFIEWPVNPSELPGAPNTGSSFFTGNGARDLNF